MILSISRNLKKKIGIESRRISLLCERFRKLDFCIGLITNDFRRSMKNRIIFEIFFFYFLFHHLSFRKTATETKGPNSCYHQRIV